MVIPLKIIERILNKKSLKEFNKFMERKTVSFDPYSGDTVISEDDFLRFIGEKELK